VAAVVLFVLLATVTVLVLAGGTQGVDALAERWAGRLRSARVVPVWQFISDMASNGALAAVGIAASLLLVSARRAADLRPLWLAGLGAIATTWSAKYVLGLPRPEFTTLAVAVSPTFPSAHATGAMAVYGVLAWLAGRVLSKGKRVGLAIAATALILAVGCSRVVLGVHYASDVAAGFLIGAFWLVVATAAASRR
jgi:undecaprenyl-diphosphatase